MGVDLDQWSREDLEAEAKARGIGSYEAMTRSELLRALLSTKRSGGLLGALFGKVVERVREVLPLGSSRPSPTSVGASGPHERASAGRAASAKSAPSDEPILTRTMAGLLAAQGHHARALAIYEHLLARTPADARLVTETTDLRMRMGGERVGGDDEVVMVALPDSRFLVSWDVGDDSIARARGLAGDAGLLVVRVVVIAPAGSANVETRAHEQKGVAQRGEWVLEGLPALARATASVGVESPERFVSAAHTRVVRF